MNAKTRLTDAETALVKQAMASIMIETARARATITYGDLAARLPVHIHPHSFVFARLLRAVCAEELQKGHGQLCTLVVSKATGLPSGGYFVGTAVQGRETSDLEAEWRKDLEALWGRWVE
jgi:hypothetical protein